MMASTPRVSDAQAGPAVSAAVNEVPAMIASLVRAKYDWPLIVRKSPRLQI